MKVTVKAALFVAIGAAAGCGVLDVEAAEAASVVNFSYEYRNDFSNPGGLDLTLAGSVTGDIVGDEVTNLTNLSALLLDVSGQSGGSPFSLEFLPGASQFFTLSGTNLNLSFQGLISPAINAALNNNALANVFAQASLPGAGVVEDDLFGKWQTSVQPTQVVPTPALLPGLMLMGGALRRRLRRNQEEAA